MERAQANEVTSRLFQGDESLDDFNDIDRRFDPFDVFVGDMTAHTRLYNFPRNL